MAGQNEIIGFGAEQAQVMAGGAVGAALRLYLRPAGSWLRSIVTATLCVGAARVFAPDLRITTGHIGFLLSAETCGALVALGCFGVAEGLLKAIERFDFAAVLKRKEG
jgi:hypothetical protein